MKSNKLKKTIQIIFLKRALVGKNKNKMLYNFQKSKNKI